MRKTAVAGLAASLLTLGGFAGTAQAQCVWTGAGWACALAPMVVVPPPAVVVYPAPNPAYGRYGWDWWGPEQNGKQAGFGTGD